MARWIKVLLQVTALAVLVILAERFERLPQPIKTVQMEYNGLGWTTDTGAWDVAELLVAQFGSYEGWLINPVPDTRLTDGMTISVKDQKATTLNPTVAKNYQTRQSELAKASLPPPKPTDIRSGLATWYRFGDKLTAASRKYPKGTKLRVIAVNSGKSVEVTINDYGPSVLTGIDLDLNEPAFAALAPLGAGKIKVKYYKL